MREQTTLDKMSIVNETSNASNTLLPTPPASTDTEGSPPSKPASPKPKAVDIFAGNQFQTDADPSLEVTAQPTDLEVEVPVQDAEANPENGWSSAASLYCPSNGRSHATILEFGFDECPKCAQDLTTTRISCVEPGEPGEPESPSSLSLPDGEQDPTVTYSMEIRSRDDTFVHNVPYSKPFDLSVSQQAVDLQHVIYNITTVLETSLAAYDCILSEDEIESLEQGIVNIASIDVSLRSTRVTICSESLLKVIARVVTYYPSAKLGGKVLQLDEPYPLIAHYFDDFEAYRATYREPDVDPLCPLVAKDSPTQPPCDEEEFNHLGSFLDFFKTSGYMAQVNDEKARHTQNLCTFRMLWLLFKPGETVYMVSEGQMSAYVIQSVEVDRKVLSSRVFTKPYSVYLWNLQYDGRFVGRSSEFVYVSPFDGERQITSLKIFPSHFYDRTDGEKTREHLIRQGQQWYESLQGRQMIYSGEFLGSSKRRVNIHSLDTA